MISRHPSHVRPLCAIAFAGLILLSACAPLPLPANPDALANRASASTRESPSDDANTGVNGEEGENESEIKPYDDVITAEAETQQGMLIVHRVGDKFYFEIPAAMLGRDMLWHVETAAVPPGLAVGHPLGKRMVRLERRGNAIDVRDYTVSVTKRAGDAAVTQLVEDGAALGVSQVTLPILMHSFPIAAIGPDDAAVIEVTSALASDLAEFSPADWLTGMGLLDESGGTVDEERSYVREIKAFPRNVEVRNALTYGSGTASYMTGSGSVSIELRHSILLLPDEPMTPRYADPRVGYFSESFEDYSNRDDNAVVMRQLITRYQLEKKDPDAALSEPVIPIVFYISRTMPQKWVDYVKRGVEAWQPAFEAAGFKNAIQARLAPSAEEDPAWDAFDARNSVIRWEYASQFYLGLGLQITDPRTGEALCSRIFLTADLIAAQSFAYFAQVSALDEDARKLPLPDDLAGKLLQWIVSHEVGHALGLAHNFKASQAYTTAQLRDLDFVKENGITASVMAYPAYNYVAQPGDGVTELIPRLGPYDTFAIKWGYTPIPDAKTPADKAPVLDGWAAEQLANPWLAYDGDYEMDDDWNDPTVQVFNLGADRVEAARLGVKNMEYSLTQVISATTDLGNDYARLAQAYGELLGMRANVIVAASNMAGGVVERRALGGRADAEYAPVPAEEQRAAVRFVVEQLDVPAPFLRPDVMYRLAPIDVMGPLQSTQSAVLGSLLDGMKYRALADLEATQPDRGYLLMDYLSDVQDGVWRELREQPKAVHPMRRALQRAYLDIVERQMAMFGPEGEPDSFEDFFNPDLPVLGTDFRAAARANLRALLGEINGALEDATEPMTKAHLEDARDHIEVMVKGPTT